MADDTHRIRIILEAVSKGGDNLSRFFRDSDREIKKFRKTLGDAGKDLEVVMTASGPRGRTISGQFASLRGDIEKTADSLRKFKEENRRGFAPSDFIRGIKRGLEEEVKIRQAVNDRINKSEKDRIDELEKLEVDFADKKATRLKKLEENENAVLQRRKLQRITDDAAEIRDLRLKAQILDAAIRKRVKDLTEEGILSRKAIEASVKGEKKERDEIYRTIAAIEDKRDADNKLLETEQVNNRKRIILLTNLEKARAKRAVTRPDRVQVEQEERTRFSQDIDKDTNSIRRFGATAGRSFIQFFTGVRLARGGLTDLEKQTLKNSSAITRFGARVGNTVASISAFRARTVALFAILQILGTLVTQLGAALIALASSATLAAAALGGALLAGAAQLLPIVGLLAAAFSRLGKVLDAAQLADKLELSKAEDTKTKLDGIRQATQRLADARYTLLKAGEAVKDAEFDLAQAQKDVQLALKDQQKAIKDLADARKEAARDIVDANLEEKEAALAVQEANLAVLDAKRRLREEEQKAQLSDVNIADAQAQVREAQDRLAQVRKEGDEAEVTVALQQLNQAEQSLQEIKNNVSTTQSDLKRAQIDVKQAQVNQQQAVIRNKRAQEDAKRLREEGVGGSDKVQRAQEQLANATRNVAQAQRQQVLAQRAIRDSLHALAVAQRELSDSERDLADARKKGTAQQEQLQKALSDLSPAEKRLFQSIQRFKKAFEQNFRGVTDIIVDSFARALDKITPLLSDPKLVKAAKQLAEAIALSVDKLSDFAVSPEFKKFLEFSILQAAKNTPKITDGFIALGRVLIRVARAATPIFNELLDRFVKFLQRLDEGTRDPSRLNKFFETAGKHLDSWIAFAVAVGRILGLLIKFSAPAGKGLLDDLTAKLNEWTTLLRENEPEVRKFFARIRVQVGDLARTLTRATVILFKAFSSESAARLTQFILDTAIPAFALFLQLLSLIAGGLIEIFKVPLVGPLVQNFVKFSLTLVLMIKLVKTLIPLFKVFNTVLAALFTTAGRARVIAFLTAALGKLAVAIRIVGIALRFVFITNPWIAVIVGIIAAIVLLDRKFHFLAPTIKFIGKIFREIFEFIKKHWKLLIAILLGPFGIVILGIIKFRSKIYEIFKAIVNFIRDHWKLIVGILLAPFLIGGAIILGIIKFRGRLLELIRAIPNLIVKAFEKLPGLLLKIFEKIPGLLKDALSGLGGVVEDVLQGLPVVGRFFGGGGPSDDDKKRQRAATLAALPKKARKRGAELLDEHGSSRLGIAKTLLALVDEGIITEDQLDNINKTLRPKLKFRTGGTVPGGAGQAVPAIVHAGEWILNKIQQKKLAERLGQTVEQTKMTIFGTNLGPNPPGPSSTKTRPTSREPIRTFRRFNLIPQEDPESTGPDGKPIIVWFIEMDDGAFGQVSPKDAKKIIATNGTFIPGYVKRSTHGFSAKLERFRPTPERLRKVRGGKGNPRGFALGGVVQAFANGGVVQRWARPMIQSFAEGGTVMSSPGFAVAAGTTSNKNITQNFEVTTQGETDWAYVLRMGAMHARTSYT